MTVAQQREMGRQLDAQFERTQLAALEIVAFGAMFMRIEEAICAERGTDRHIGGKNTKGKGFKGWFAEFAPRTCASYSNARRYRDIGRALQIRLSLKSAEQLQIVATPSEHPKLEPKLAKKRVDLIAVVTDKSTRGMQTELGLVDEATARTHTPPKKLTPEQRREEWKAAARENAIRAFDSLLRLEERWKLLTDDQLALAQKLAGKLAKEIDRWLSTPADRRAALQLEKYLGAEEAA